MPIYIAYRKLGQILNNGVRFVNRNSVDQINLNPYA